MLEKICPICNQNFIKKSNSQKYCSTNCFNKNLKKVHKDYHKKKYKKKVGPHGNTKYFTAEDKKKARLKAQKLFKNKFLSTEKGKNWYREYMKKYRNTESGKKSHRESSRNWYHNLKKNPERFSYYKITHNLRKRVREIIKRNQRKDFLSGPGSKLFGCTSQQLRKYLEKLFKPGMTWENYGKWHVDHIVPISKFNLKNPEERNKCFHYTNLQPLWAKENMMKGDKQYN